MKGKGWKGSEGKDGGKDGKGKWKGPQVNKVAGQPGETSPQKDVKPTDSSQGQSTPERTQQESGRAPSSETTDASTKGLVDEVTSLLKSMRVAQSSGGRPALSAIKLRKMDAGRHTTVLLDGGATNCLRRARSDQEYQQAEPVQVSLASGSVSMRQSPQSRTLLVKEEVQPIVPLSDLINIGVSIEWNDRGCKMKHAGRILPVYLDEGCPVIGLTEGLDLMRQVEEFHERRAKLRLAVVRVAGGEALPAGHDLEEVEAVNFAEDFPEVPPRLIERVPGKVRWDPALVPMNRRLRKRIQKAKTIIIHLYSGTETSLWDTHGEENMMILNIEIKRGMDMHNDHLFGFLEQLCQSGRVRGVYAGPPCRTVSLLRFQQEEGGPRPLRSRDGIHRFGLPWLTALEQAEADGDTILWLRTLQLMTVALEESVECAVAIEQPEDPARWKEDDPELHGGWGYPSFMTWTETRQFAERFGLEFVHFDQKVLGHIRKKPTTMLTNMVTLRELQGRRDTTPDQPWPTTLKERMKESARLAEWAPAMQILMIREALNLHRRYEQRVAARLEERQRQNASQRSSWTLRSDRHLQRLMALSTKEQIELADWQYHINNGHVPFRRDCYQCQESQGRDRQRRRVETPQGYTLNFDISGPYEAGFDQRQGRCKYFLAASFSVPSRGSTPLAEGLRCCGGGNIVHSDVELGSGLDPRLERIENIEDMEEIFGASPPAPEEEYLVAGEEEREALTEIEVKEIEVANAKWKELVEGMKDVEMKFLTFAVPLTSRHGSEITRALSLIYVRLRSMNLPVVRCHSDRAKEFISRGVQQWMLNRDILHTFSAGDEAAGCGQIENLVNVLKGRSRVLMKAAKCERSLWPLAVRFAAEQRMREALSTMGIRLPVLIPFGASASAKVKRWHRRQGDDGWNGPYRQVRVWGPAFDMSPTSHGYFIEADGHWMRSTVIVRGQAPPPQLDLQLPESGEQPRPVVDEDAAPSIAPDEEFLMLGQEQEEGDQEVEIWEEGSEHADPQLHGPDPPRRRITGKQHVPLGSNGVRPILRALRIGGEWSWELDLTGEQSEEQNKLESNVSVRRLQSDRALLTLQHREAQQWLLEEKSLSDYENVGEVTMAVQEEINAMEKRFKKMEALEEKAVEKECLVTRTVELAEVRQDLEGWREAISKEYESLLQHRAIQPIGGAEFEELKNSNKQLEIIPAKLVATVKPPHRRKARVVGCGNQAQWVEEDVTAGGIDTIAVRAIVSGAASNQWKISVADFKTAFLQAPRRDVGNKCTIVTPPQVLRDLKLMEYGDQERWVVKGALYGLAESPKDWACFRDARMRTMRWSDEEGHSWMESTPEAHVWKVKKNFNHPDVDKKESAEKEEGEVVAIIGVYVDDLIISAKEKEMQRILQEFAKNFNMAEPEVVNRERTVSFCGYELKEVNGGFEVGQTKYATEMVKRRNVEGIENIPCPKLEEGADEEVDMMDLREAQQLTGELSWLASRSRPDLMYTVGAMSRLLHRRPKYVCKLGWWAMRYIAGTCNRVLRFEAVPEIEKNDLVVAVDTSYAPPHENYKSIQGMMITHGKNAIMWSSTRQPFVAQSTCEAELIGYNECVQNVESLSELMSIWGYKMKKKILGDSKAGISQLTSDGGSWRTRHLRIRSAKLRELLQHGEGDWSIEHREGNSLVSDGLTKALQGAKFASYVSMLGMVMQEKVSKDEETGPSIRSMKVGMEFDVAKVALGAGLAMILKDHKEEGALLLALAGLSALYGKWKQNTKRPEKEMKRPQKDLQKNTPKGVMDGAAHPPLFCDGVTGTANFDLGSPSDIGSVGLGCRAPGLRAYRVSSDVPASNGGGKAKGKHLHGGKDPRARGEAAMRLHDWNQGWRYHEEAVQQATDYAPVSMPGKGWRATTEWYEGRVAEEAAINAAVAASRAEGAVHRGATKDEVPRQGAATSSSGMMSGATGVDTTGRSKTAPGDVPEKGKGKSERRGYGGPTMIRSGGEYFSQVLEQPSGTEFVGQPGSTPMAELLQPWVLNITTGFPCGKKDMWDTTLLHRRWLVRHHAGQRKQLFHPLHSSTPIDVSELDGQRVTLMMHQDGSREIDEDDWISTRRYRYDGWRGYTFLRLRDARREEQDTAAEEQGERPTEEVYAAAESFDGGFEDPPFSTHEPSDGSFELVLEQP